MDDLADQIDDFICSFEGAGDLTMDTLAMLIFCWAVVALFLVWFCKFIYHRYIRKTPAAVSETAIKTDAKLKTETAERPADLPLENGAVLATTPVLVEATKVEAKVVQKKRSGVGYVPPTPPTRKRLSRKSPGPELRRSAPPPSAPPCAGPDSFSVRWVNELLHWLYTDQVIACELLQLWVQALNEHGRKALDEHGVGVELVRLLPETPAPNVSNVFAENMGQDVIVTMDIETTPVLQLKAYRQKSGKTETAHYRVNVNRFRGRLSAKMERYHLRGEIKPEGWPDVRISLAAIGAIRTGEDENQLQELIIEIVTSALRATAAPLDFSIYPTCPRYKDEPTSCSPASSTMMNLDGLLDGVDRSNLSSPVPGGRRLLVKVVRGEGLGGPSPTTAREPYCVVEMDEPPQRNQTGTRVGDNPFWDEHFLFDISPNTAELLFEVYDRPAPGSKDGAGDTRSDQVPPTPRFLGLGLVGVDELAVGPSSCQVLSLQPKPYEEQKVFGAITVEFVFIEGAEVPQGRRPYKLKEALHLQGKSPTKATYNGSPTNGVDLADSAIRAIESGVTAGPNVNKSTLIIHSVQRQQPERQTLKVEMTQQGSFVEVEPTEEVVIAEQTTNELNQEPLIIEQPSDQPSNGTGTLQDGAAINDDRGRGRKKRDFFGTIKRRLGRSKNRSKSMDRAMAVGAEAEPGIESRSISADRGQLSGSSPGVGTRLLVPLDGSRRSSISEGSAVSGTSVRTYVNEASTLVLETLENGVRRHFLVPIAVAQRPRWRRKGTKLHIYNDHTFVAKHLSGGQLCSICQRSIPRRPGKQGYECRDCNLRCHKQCHVKAPQLCPNPTVLSIELSKLNSPLADRHIRKL